MVAYQLLFGALGLLCGIGVAAGVFALVASLGMVKNQCGGLCACTGKRTDCRRNLWLCAGCFPGASISGWNMVPGGVWTGLRCIFRLSVRCPGGSAQRISGAVSQNGNQNRSCICKGCRRTGLFFLCCRINAPRRCTKSHVRST